MPRRPVQPRGLPFVGVGAGYDSAEVGGTSHGCRCEIYGEFAAFGDKAVGEASGPHGDVQHGRVGTHRSRPCHSEQIVAPVVGAAHQNGRQRVEECAGLPVQLHCAISASTPPMVRLQYRQRRRVGLVDTTSKHVSIGSLLVMHLGLEQWTMPFIVCGSCTWRFSTTL